jgi:hypothetical protein
MNETERIVKVNEIGEKEYAMLQTTYCRLKEMRSRVSAMHAASLEGSAPDFDQVEALHILMEEAYGELERFVLSVCASEGSCAPSMCD